MFSLAALGGPGTFSPGFFLLLAVALGSFGLWASLYPSPGLRGLRCLCRILSSPPADPKMTSFGSQPYPAQGLAHRCVLNERTKRRYQPLSYPRGVCCPGAPNTASHLLAVCVGALSEEINIANYLITGQSPSTIALPPLPIPPPIT